MSWRDDRAVTRVRRGCVACGSLWLWLFGQQYRCGSCGTVQA